MGFEVRFRGVGSARRYMTDRADGTIMDELGLFY
jgi:hypothetical protein